MISEPIKETEVVHQPTVMNKLTASEIQELERQRRLLQRNLKRLAAQLDDSPRDYRRFRSRNRFPFSLLEQVVRWGILLMERIVRHGVGALLPKLKKKARKEVKAQSGFGSF